MTADQPRDLADGMIEVEGDKPKVEATRKYFAAIFAGLRTAEEYAREMRAELDEARRERDDWRKWAEARLEFRDQRDEAVAQTATLLAERDGLIAALTFKTEHCESVSTTNAAYAKRLAKAEAALQLVIEIDDECPTWWDDPVRGVGAIARAYFAEAGREEPTA